MINHKQWIACLFFCCSLGFSNDEPFNVYQDFLVGYRSDRLSWTISGDQSGQNPNILSELTWWDLHTINLGYHIDHELSNGLTVQGQAEVGRIVTGKNRDSDYSLDNRQGEFSRSYANASGGMVYDFSLGIGAPLVRKQGMDNLMILPLVGLDYHRQQLTMKEPAYFFLPGGTYLIVSGSSLEGLNASYRTDWFGPWGGAEVILAKQDGWKYFVQASWHWPFYHAQANWNLRTDLKHPVSFEHFATGHGTRLTLGYARELKEKEHFVTKFTYEDWKTTPGKDLTYMVDPDQTGETQLNKVYWNRIGLMVGLKLDFS